MEEYLLIAYYSLRIFFFAGLVVGTSIVLAKIIPRHWIS